MSEERLNQIDQRLDGLQAEFAEFRADTNRDFVNVRTDMDELRRHMGVLHEETLERIAAIPDHTPRLEAKIDQAVADITEAIGRRLDPLEAVVRSHSAALSRHEVEIASLKRRRK